MPLFLYPFLNTSSKTRPFEYLRLTSLGVIGALVKVTTYSVLVLVVDAYLSFRSCWTNMSDIIDLPQVDDTEVINFLLSTEIIPLCLRTMEMGSELSKTVATFIVQKILLDNVSVAPTMSRANDIACVLDQRSDIFCTDLCHLCRLV